MSETNVTLQYNRPQLSSYQIVAEVYGYYNNVWQPNRNPRDDGVAQFKSDGGLQIFKDSITNNYSNLFNVISADNDKNSLLSVDTGFVVKKDIHAGGILSSDQGAILLGHGLFNANDPPKISLMNADFIFAPSGPSFPSPATYGQNFYQTTSYGGNPANWLYLYGSDAQWHPVQGSLPLSGVSLPSGGILGQLFILRRSPGDDDLVYYYNGATWYNIGKAKFMLFISTDTTPNMLYQWNDASGTPASTWASLGSMENFVGGDDTLYLTRTDGKTLANMKLNNLTAGGDRQGGAGETVVSVGGNSGYSFEDRSGFVSYGRWVWYANTGTARLWGSSTNSDLLSIDSSGNLRIGGKYYADSSTAGADGSITVGSVTYNFKNGIYTGHT